MHSQVFCALREWETGERITKEFKDYVYQPIYEEFCNHLKGLMATFTEAKKKLAADHTFGQESLRNSEGSGIR